MSKKKSVKRPTKRVRLSETDDSYQSANQIPPNQSYIQTQQTFPDANQPQGGTQSQPVEEPTRVYPSVGIGISRDSVTNQPYLHKEPIGSSGTQSYSGYPREEYLDKLLGYQKAQVFDQMKRGDSAVKMCLSAVKNPIKAATWDVEPANAEDPDSVNHADFIKFALFKDSNKPWDEFVSEALTLIEQGFSAFEIIDKVVLNDPVWGHYIGIKSLSWRSQKTIQRFYLDGQTGELTGLMQLAYGDVARNVTIPAAFLLLFTMDKEGSNYEGISMLRPCYGPWWRKDTYLKINAIGIEKFAIPTPFIEVPDGKQNSSEYDSLIAALQIYTTHQANYLAYPQGWKIDLKPTNYDPQKVEASIDNEDKRITQAFLGNFLTLGQSSSSSGNRSLSEDLSAIFLGSIEYIANELASTINKVLIKRLVDLKFGPQSEYPTLKASGITDKAGLEFAQLLKALADSQYITPDDNTEEHLRKRVGLPKMSKIGQRAVKSVGASGSAGPANPDFTQASEGSLLNRIKLAEKRRLESKTSKNNKS